MGRYVALGLTSKKLGYYLAKAVVDSGEVQGVLVVKLGVDKLHEKLIHKFEQRGEDIMIADKHGVVFISTEPKWLFKSLNLLSEEELKSIEQHKTFAGMQINPLSLDASPHLEKSSRLLNNQGMSQRLIYHNYLKPLRVSVNVAVPLQEFYDIRRLSLFAGLILGLFLSTLIILFSYRERYQKILCRTQLLIH